MYETNYQAPRPFVRGGTYFTCRLTKRVTTLVPKLDKNGRKTRYKSVVVNTVDCNYHAKIGKPGLMLRHMRKVHDA